MWRSLTDALKARELIMDFIEPVSMRAGTCTPSRTQKQGGALIFYFVQRHQRHIQQKK